jgi:hypothetical protein
MSSLVGVCTGVSSTVATANGYIYVCSTPIVPADFSLFMSQDLDMDALSVAFGGCLLMFAIGSGIGSIINILRKARV